jgi:hypothetical protein
MLTNLAKVKIAALAVLLFATTTAAVAQPRMPVGPQSPYACFTDQGQGRFVPCGAGS